MTALISVSSTPDSRSPVLSVIDGLHQGVALSLDQPVYTLGSALQCDLVLGDAGIADEHLRLRINERDVAIEALGGDVLVVGKGAAPVTLAMGSGHRARWPVEVRIGGARLTLAKPESAASAPTRRLPTPSETRWLWIAALVALLLGGSAFALQEKPAALLSTVAVAPVQTVAPQPVQFTLAQARQWFEQQLQAEGLRSVTLSEAGDQLLAHGSVEKAMKARWATLQQSFDQRFGRQWMLRSSVTVRPEIVPPRVRFQAVWFGNEPYVINDNGKRLYPGAALPDNWVLERIDAHEVVLARGEERFTLTL